MEKVLKNRNSIYGILIIWIMLFHIYRKVGVPFDYLPIKGLLSLGNIGVDAFLFLSGYCLCLSLNKDSKVFTFYKKRASRLILPYIVITIPFFIWRSIVEKPSDSFINFKNLIIDITGYSYWAHGVTTTWFFFCIAALYIITPPLHYVMSKSKAVSFLLIFVVYVLVLLLANIGYTYTSKSVTSWARIPIFIMGIYFALYKNNLRFNQASLSISLCYLSIVLLIYPINSYLTYVPVRFLSFMLIAIPLVLVLGRFNGLYQGTFGKLLSFTGSLSFELYLVHVTLIHVINYYIPIQTFGWKLYILIPIISILYSLIIQKIVNWIKNLISPFNLKTQ